MTYKVLGGTPQSSPTMTGTWELLRLQNQMPQQLQIPCLEDCWRATGLQVTLDPGEAAG